MASHRTFTISMDRKFAETYDFDEFGSDKPGLYICPCNDCTEARSNMTRWPVNVHANDVSDFKKLRNLFERRFIE